MDLIAPMPSMINFATQRQTSTKSNASSRKSSILYRVMRPCYENNEDKIKEVYEGVVNLTTKVK